ncbi:MAG: dihydropteroate synthase [Longimicrobiales bacterium]
MIVSPAVRSDWITARGSLSVARPLVVGILNLTPDSFYDGGRHATPADAVARAEQLISDGAAILDIGGESTRPGAQPLDVRTELERVMPVIETLGRRWPEIPLSVDTMKAEVAEAVLDAGAAIINDVTALRHDPALAAVVAAKRAGLVLMHSRGAAGHLADYALADYTDDVVADVVAELETARAAARSAGIADEAIVLDPGVGFAKRTEHSIAVLRDIDRIVALGAPVMIGPSRKRFIGELSGGLPAGDRLPGTIAACVHALAHGVRLFRVHDVRDVRRAIDVAASLAGHT